MAYVQPNTGHDHNHVSQLPSATTFDGHPANVGAMISKSSQGIFQRAVGPVEQDDDAPLLRYRKRAIYLLIFYLPLLIIPWALTCILSVRPLNGKSYISQSGLSPQVLTSIAQCTVAIAILNSTAGVVTVPITSALLAQAAVVYCQRPNRNQKLNVKQLLALADLGWSDITILWTSWTTWRSSYFLWFSAFLIFISKFRP